MFDKIKAKGQEIAQAAKEKHDAVFRSSKEIKGDVMLIPCIAEQIIKKFKSEGFEVDSKKIENHYDISLTNGGLVKASVGLKTALMEQQKLRAEQLKLNTAKAKEITTNVAEKAKKLGKILLAAGAVAAVAYVGLKAQSNMANNIAARQGNYKVSLTTVMHKSAKNQ